MASARVAWLTQIKRAARRAAAIWRAYQMRLMALSLKSSGIRSGRKSCRVTTNGWETRQGMPGTLNAATKPGTWKRSAFC